MVRPQQRRLLHNCRFSVFQFRLARIYPDGKQCCRGWRLGLGTRKHPDNSVVGPDQAVSLDDAIRAVTIDAARQLGQGDRLGSLEKGKEADFTILESDPYKVNPDAIADIKVSETWVAGERKFAA